VDWSDLWQYARGLIALATLVTGLLTGQRRGWWAAIARWVSRRFNLERDNARLLLKVTYLESVIKDQTVMIKQATDKAESAAQLSGLLEADPPLQTPRDSALLTPTSRRKSSSTGSG
jgi:hypothetical protein